MLDNTGHEAQNRARGTKAKDDLNEVVYALKPLTAFSAETTGKVELKRTRTRFSEAPERLTMTLGGGTYRGPEPTEAEPDDAGFRPTHLMERASKIVEAQPGVTRNELLALMGGSKEYALMAATRLVAEEYVSIEPGPNRAQHHHPNKPYREPEDPRWDGGSQVGPKWVPGHPGTGGSGGSVPEGGPTQGPRPPDHPGGSRPEEGS